MGPGVEPTKFISATGPGRRIAPVENRVPRDDDGCHALRPLPCFVAGTHVLVPVGERRVEDLVPGDLVTTQDQGPQPLRWVGCRVVPAVGALAPIRVRANTFGRHGALLVSPRHLIRVRDVLEDLLAGSGETRIAAGDLVNGRSVQRVEGGMVVYVQLLFDRPQVIWSEGLLTDTFEPEPERAHRAGRDTGAEIAALFADRDAGRGAGDRPLVRPAARSRKGIAA